MKECNSCLTLLPATAEYFYFHSHSGALRARCKSCLKAEAKQHYERNREERIRKAREYRRMRRQGFPDD